jgi:tRNA-specific 2-thiouridylase
MGLAFFTLGQRKGIGLGGSQDGNGDAWYVARKDMANNTLYVAQGHEHPWLLAKTLEAIDASWIAGTAPASGSYSAKTRYRQADSACTLTAGTADLSFKLGFPDAQWAVTPGQSAVLYDGDICLGGGIISASSQ